MPDLLRRVAALTLVTAVGVAVLAPLSAASAKPEADPPGLLAAGLAQAIANRGSTQGRELSARFTLDALRGVIAPESLSDAEPLPSPASVTMQATLVQRSPVLLAAAPRAPAPPVTASRVRGAASWYCCTIGYRGMAVVALPGPMGGRYDPAPASRVVTICADRCAELPVVDYCDCYWGTGSQRVADLSPEAWAAITDRARSTGLIRVTVHL